MNDQLEILEKERERLRTTLADDPQWQALEQALATLSAGQSPDGLTLAEAQALAGHPVIAAYMQITDEIEQLRGAMPKGDRPATFRTRVHVKTTGEGRRRAQGADDLTAIRRVDRALAAKLNDLGVFSYATIAGWDRYEVRRVRDALQLGKRIWRENWIEQAALLAMREESEPPGLTRVVIGEVATGVASGDGIATETVAIQRVTLRPRVLNEPTTTVKVRRTVKVGRKPSRLPAPAARRFAYIQGVSDGLAAEMRAAGVSSLADIAGWTRADVKWFQAILGDQARISQNQWIEQATLLSRGVWTRHALRVVGGETRVLVEMPQPVEPVVSVAETGATEAASELVIGPIALPDVELMAAVPEVPEVPTSVGDTAEPVAEPTAEPNAPLLIAERPERNNGLRGLSTAIVLGKLKRPPPDLGSRGFDPIPKQKDIAPPVPSPDDRQMERRLEDAATALFEDETAVDAGHVEVGAATTRVDVVQYEPGDFAVDSDWDDAEALVIQRGDATVVADNAGHGGDGEHDAHSNARGADDAYRFELAEGELFWGDEAEVMIVSRPRGTATVYPSSNVDGDGGKRELPVFVAKHERPPRQVDDYREAERANYFDAMEEATVTIIRAEASETRADSIWPSEIANDAGSVNELAAGKPGRHVRGLRSRFLKALTGE